MRHRRLRQQHRRHPAHQQHQPRINLNRRRVIRQIDRRQQPVDENVIRRGVEVIGKLRERDHRARREEQSFQVTIKSFHRYEVDSFVSDAGAYDEEKRACCDEAAAYWAKKIVPKRAERVFVQKYVCDDNPHELGDCLQRVIRCNSVMRLEYRGRRFAHPADDCSDAKCGNEKLCILRKHAPGNCINPISK